MANKIYKKALVIAILSGLLLLLSVNLLFLFL